MSWVIYILIVLAVVAIGIFAYFYYKKSLDKEEKRLIKFLKKQDGEGDPRFLKRKMGVSRAWLESVAKRLEEKGRVVRWGWRAKSLICLKGAVVKSEKRVVKLLKKNGGMMGQLEAGRALGYDRESFGWRMVRKLEEKGVLWVRVEGKKNYLVLTGEGRFRELRSRIQGASGPSAVAKLDKSEDRMVKILRKSGGEMLDRNLALRVRGASKIIKSLIKKGVVFRWGAKKRNVCLKDVLSKDEEKIVRIVKDAGGKMMWTDLVKKSGYSGKGFHRVLDKLEMKGKIFRRKVGRSLEVVV
ncbi:hypothetical protein HN935_02645 [archaeon]|jgi:predicted transcriptional regulator|nr:hypothetical protein [archaeon]